MSEAGSQIGARHLPRQTWPISVFAARISHSDASGKLRDFSRYPILPKRSDLGVMVSRMCWCFWEVRGAIGGSNPTLSARRPFREVQPNSQKFRKRFDIKR